MKKQLWLAGFIFLFLSLSRQNIFAADTGSPAIRLNDTRLETNAVIEEGYLYLPVRAIGESLGYDVNWSQKDRSMAISSKDKVISLNFEESKIMVNDHDTYMPDNPVVINGITFIRADFFSDNLGLKVQWDKEKNTVLLSSIKENAITINTVKTASETSALKSTIQYPVIEELGNREVQDKINAIFKQLADDAAQQGVKNAADLAPYILEFPDMPGQCETYFNYQVKYNQNDVISLIFLNYQFAGGAHGSTLQTAYTVNLKTGKQYTLKDLFKENTDYVSIFSDNVKIQLAERDLTSILFEPFNKINENQSYYLSNNGVVVYFQQYEILPYAAGIQEFTVDYSLLNSLFIEPDVF
ncbi:MAG: stalk domain-containing protein [Flexilinea sp.]